MKEVLKNLPAESLEFIKDIAFFTAFVILGAMAKVIKEKEKTGKKVTARWFITEAIMSFFVAVIVYAVFDQFLSLNKFFTFAMCALGGSFSTVFHQKIEDLIGVVFDAIKNKVQTLIK